MGSAKEHPVCVAEAALQGPSLDQWSEVNRASGCRRVVILSTAHAKRDKAYPRKQPRQSLPSTTLNGAIRSARLEVLTQVE
ncbi:unnamed protein product [Heligmosomoides polygyrus]|uniref:NAD(P)-bd_dom domain-containing protein n=1 Tax=Heligmosomoides polygyrus TaxID=6339 RepID=A0A183GHT1_HELPZ|nr:unnamed protein product [Heligmosomoides polygyrus]